MSYLCGMKPIVFLKDKDGAFKLRNDIESFGVDKGSGLYYVRFTGHDNTLLYNPAKVDAAEFSRRLEPPFRVRRTSDNELFHHVLGVSVYEGRTNTGYRVAYENGEIKNYPCEYLSIEEHIDDRRSISVWEYLNEVSKYNVIPVDDDKKISLADKYANMDFVVKGSLLEAYLNVSALHDNGTGRSAPIFPFGCNGSQYKAVRNALEHKLSVIQGPPGTGKTQTILNIAANLLLSDKTMEIVSNNNSAIENVREKLEAGGLGFICAQLGRADNKKAFIDGQDGKLPDMSGWKLKDADAVLREVTRLSEDMQEMYDCQEKLARLSEELSEYRIQLERFPVRFHTDKKWGKGLLRKYFLICSHEMDRRHRLSPLTWFRLWLHGLPRGNDAADNIQYLLVRAVIAGHEKSCAVLQDKVKDINVQNTRLKELSMLVLKDKIARKYSSREPGRRIFSADDLYFNSRAFLKEYPVVLSTTFSATSNINKAERFDYLIMDEASQVDIAAGALALSCADNAVIAGDLKQLPNVVDSHMAEMSEAVFVKYQLPAAYKYTGNSFLSSICTLMPNVPQVLLREHYRCDPLIIGFCSKQFYGGELIPMRSPEGDVLPMRVVRTAKGDHARGTRNMRQAEIIAREVVPSLEEHFTDIGIIAPYNEQVRAIKSRLAAEGKDYETATVHKFQGREKDAIVLSTVDNQIREFTDDPHLLNVAISRAKRQFTLVVSADVQSDTNIQNLIEYIEYYNGSEVQSRVASIFDLLYKSYTQELLAFYKTHKRVSEYDSENLAYWCIHDTLKEMGLGHMGILMHYPLRHLISRGSGLDEEQREYASRSWTHLDFLIYDTVSHRAKLAIEVDGTQFHRSDSRQGRRDRLKDSVLEAIGLPLLRWSTAGAGEKESLKKALSAGK